MAEPYHFDGRMANAPKVLSPEGPFKERDLPMFARSRISRIVTSWILGTALALLSTALVLGGETVIPH
jgi:hypothetical protein